MEQIPDAVRTEGDVHHLAEYFTARLCDWPAIRGALHGCLALLSREPPRATLATADAITLMAAMIDGVYVRSLSATDRAIAILVLHVAVQRHGQGLLDAGQDIMEFTIASVDGEKDPRCLMKGFAAVRAVLELYQAQPEPSLHFGRLEDSTEELFDVLSCYFPVSFTPPPNDQHGITRDGIAAELQATLVAFPAFAPLLVPLALEKLSSTVRVAKLDALNLLGAAAEAYGPEPLAQHVPAIWAGVRAELMAPTSEGLLDAQVAALEELAAAAAAALSRCIRAFAAKDGMALSALVLEDTAVEDVLRCTASPGMEPAAFRRSALRTKAGAVMLEALGNAGGAPAHNMAAKVLQPLVVSATEQEQAYMQAVVGPRTAQLCALRLTWAAILTLVRSLAVGLSKDSLDGHADGGIDATLLHSIVEAAAQLISQDDPSTRMMDGSGDEQRFEVWSTDPTASTPLNVVMVRLQTLQAVFTSTATAASVSKDVAGKVLDVLLQGVSSGIDALQEEATAVLSCMASPMGAHSALIVDSALPMLLAAATGVESSSAIQADVALAVVQQLSLASEAILRESVLAMDQAIQLSLPNALVDAMHLEALLRLLSAAMWVAQQGETRGTWSSKTVATELLMVLAQHLLEAVAMLDRSSLPEGSAPVSNRDLLTAVAGFLSITTRNGGQNVQQLGEVAIEIMANASGFEEENAIADLKAAATCGAIIGLDAEVSRTVLANQSQDFLQSQASRTIGEHAAQPFLSKALASLMNKAETGKSVANSKASAAVKIKTPLSCNQVANTHARHAEPSPMQTPVKDPSKPR